MGAVSNAASSGEAVGVSVPGASVSSSEATAFGYEGFFFPLGSVSGSAVVVPSDFVGCRRMYSVSPMPRARQARPARRKRMRVS